MEFLPLVNYYARTGYYRHVVTVCEDAMKKRAGSSADPTVSFWSAVGLLLDGKVNESIRELEGMTRRTDMALPVKLALLHAHRQCKVVDSEEVARLDAEVRGKEEDSAPDRARLHAALVLWHFGEIHQSRRHAQALLRLNPQSVPALTLSGHLALADAEAEIEAHGDPTVHLDNAANIFEQAMPSSTSRKDVETLMGKARVHQMREQLKEALDCLNQVVVLYTWFLPALVEKCMVLMAMGDWDQAVETAQRVLAQDPQNIEALRLITLFLLSQEARHSVACGRISDLIEALDRHEPNNAALYHKTAQPFARLAGRSTQVLQLTLTLSGRACKIAPTRCEYLAEYGYQQLLLRDLTGAMATLKRAATLEDGAQVVMSHLIKCQILLGYLDDADQQLEFVREIEASLERSPEMSLNAALLAWQRRRSVEEAIAMLDEAVEVHMNQIKRAPFNDQYFVRLNPVLLLELAQEFLRHCGPEPEVYDDTSAAALVLGKASKLLQFTCAQVPGLLDGQLLLAKAHFLRYDFDAALRCCAACTKADPTFSAAALLQAQILLRSDKYREAHSVLEQALAHNFSVRDSPVFHLVKARVLRNQGEPEEALRVLETALSLRGVQSAGDAGWRDEGDINLSAFDRCSVFVLTVQVQLELKKMKEAKALLNKASYEFSDTPQEGRITIVSAELEVARGKIDKAITMLQGIEPDSPHYHAARSELASLYLEHRNDRHAYAVCHEELVKGNPTPQAYVTLGEAYMNISEPEKAVAAFENALRKSPGDAALASRIGKVLVATHEFVRAIEYYLEAVTKDPARFGLRYELAELYFELKKHDQALDELAKLTVAHDPNDISLDECSLQVKALMLEARVRKEQESAEQLLVVPMDGLASSFLSTLSQILSAWPECLATPLLLTRELCLTQYQIPEAMQALTRAKSVQSNILSRVRLESPEQRANQRDAAAELAFQTASYFEFQHDPDAALDGYKEVLKHDDSHPKAILAVARLQLGRGELAEAQAETLKLIRLDPESEEANMMLANIMLQKNEWDAAIFHFEEQLSKQPSNFKALAMLLQLLRRAGRLPEANKHLAAAAKSSPRAPLEAGYKFCEGVLHKYMNDPRAALTSLNLARRDGEWGERAVMTMIEIYLNPENETNWDELVLDERPTGEPPEPVKAAVKLLRELPKSPRQAVLECYTFMAYKSKNHVEKACAKLLELLNVEREYVPAMVCLSQAYLMLKQATHCANHCANLESVYEPVPLTNLRAYTSSPNAFQAPKARNYLKRVAKLTFLAEMVDDFERGWLMLSDINIAGGKYDLAEELCKRCLQSNKSCAKAWEFMGMVKEKESAYRDAASCYENAWKYENEASAAVGYKLSFNYLKAKKYVDAIDVCHKVLKLYPDYPRIQNDVLEKARQALRT